MRAKIDSALSLANCASGCATETTCTVYRLMRSTFAGALTPSFSLEFYSLGPLAKNTLVAPYVPPPEYAKLIQLRNPSRRRSVEGTRRSNILR